MTLRTSSTLPTSSPAFPDRVRDRRPTHPILRGDALIPICRAVLLLPIALGVCGSSLFAADVAEGVLGSLRGHPAIVEFPDLESFDEPLTGLPEGWGFAQASGDTLPALQQRLAVTQVPALVFIDSHGNVLHREVGGSVRRKLRSGVSRFQKLRRQLRQRLARELRAAEVARANDRAAKEIASLTAVMAHGVRGYREVNLARQRLRDLDAQRRGDLLRVLASEGLRPRSRLEAELETLRKKCIGLPVEAMIEREIERFDRGLTVEERAAAARRG